MKPAVTDFTALPTAKERHVLGGIKDYLDAERIRYLRVHVGKAKRGRYWLNLAAAGTPDLWLEIPANRPVRNPATLELEQFPVARTGYIEVKHPTDGELNREQKEFQLDSLAVGALYWVARDVERVRFWIPPKMEFDFYTRR